MTLHRNILPEVDMFEFHVPRSDGSTIQAYLCPDAHPARKPKQTIIMLTGARSVVQRTRSDVLVPMLWSELMSIRAQWNIVFVERRGVSLGEDTSDTSSPPKREFVEHNTNEERISDVCDVIEWLKADGAHKGRLVVIGHSGGSDVAAGVAARNANVTHVALLVLLFASTVTYCVEGFMLPMVPPCSWSRRRMRVWRGGAAGRLWCTSIQTVSRGVRSVSGTEVCACEACRGQGNHWA